MKTRINLYSVYKWWWDELSVNDIPATEQLAMFHMIQKINENFWKPARVSLNKLAAGMMKDKRTVKKALENLVELGYLTEKEGEYFVGFSNYEQNEESGNSDNRRLDNSESRAKSESYADTKLDGERLPLPPSTGSRILSHRGETPPVKRRGLFNR